jgi:hypothetical protein
VDAGALGLVGKAAGWGPAPEGALVAAWGREGFGAPTGGLRLEVDCEDGELAANIGAQAQVLLPDTDIWEFAPEDILGYERI